MGSLTVFLGIGRLVPWLLEIGWIYMLRSSWHRDREAQPGTDGWCWLFCDRDRARHRIVVKLSFAHAEGRNYRQLPARGGLREEPSPADIFYPKRYSVSQLAYKCRGAFFDTGVPVQRLLGFDWLQIEGKSLRCETWDPLQPNLEWRPQYPLG